MPRAERTPSYIDDIVAIVTPVIECGSSFIDIPLDVFSDMGERYGLDRFDVLEDAMDAYNEIKLVREIQAGHAPHIEDGELLAIEELVGRGMITEGTLVVEVDEFVDLVRGGYITDRDGYGEFVSGDGDEFLPVHCHVAWLEEFRDEWPYIAWYGK